MNRDNEMDLQKHPRIIDEAALDRCRRRGHCEICGRPGNDPHHVISRGAGGPDHDYNLICLCRFDHNREASIGDVRMFEIISWREHKIITRETVYGIMRGDE